MKVDGSLKSLMQGVSQQPFRDRLPGQCTEQVNCSADPVTGLTRRPPTDLVEKLAQTDHVFWNQNFVPAWYDFKVKDGRKFLLAIHDGNLQVTDLNGVQQTVEIVADAMFYPSTPDGSNLRFTTVGNQTIIVNKTVVPAMSGAVSQFINIGPGAHVAGIIQILGGQYGRTYTIQHNGNTIATYTTPDGSASSMTAQVATGYIASKLVEGLLASIGPLYSIYLKGDCIYIGLNQPDGGQFALTISDDQGGINSKCCTNSVAEIADLPKFAPHGYAVRVAKQTDPEDDTWFQFIAPTWNGGGFDQGTFGFEGYWQECIAPNTQYQIIPQTMPHILEYLPDENKFQLRSGTWKDRKVGSAKANPNPSFIGTPINDCVSFAGRLWFLSGSYVCGSVTNHNDDFWQGSMSALVDTDPIDISSTASEATTMLAAIPHDRDLVIFSDKGQFIIFGRTALTPANATLVLTTSFEAQLQAKPVPAGRNVFFATNYGRFTNLREFYTEGSTDINDSRPITQHVKEYIKGTALQLSTSSNYDVLLVRTDTNRSEIAVYQYIWSDNEKVQSSWGKWTFPLDVEYVFFDEELIYFVMRPPGTADYTLHRMSLDVTDTLGIGFPVYLDSRFDGNGVYTTYTIPFDYMATQPLIVVQGLNCPHPGQMVRIKRIIDRGVQPVDGTERYAIELVDDMQGGDVITGVPYMTRYVPSKPLVTDAGGVPVGTGKLIINKFLVSLDNTGDIKARKISKWSDDEPIHFEGRILGDVENRIGMQPMSDDRIVIPFREETRNADVEIFTDSAYGMTLLDIEWQGQYTKKGQRITTGGKSG